MHVSEKLEALGQFVCSQDNVGLLNHIRPQINIFVAKDVGNIVNLVRFALRGIEIGAEIVPVKNVL